MIGESILERLLQYSEHRSEHMWSRWELVYVTISPMEFSELVREIYNVDLNKYFNKDIVTEGKPLFNIRELQVGRLIVTSG